MAGPSKNQLHQIIQDRQKELLALWKQQQIQSGVRREDLIRDKEFDSQCTEFISLLATALSNSGDSLDPNSKAFDDLRAMLSEVSESRAEQGFTPSQVAGFIFSFKQALFNELRQSISNDADLLLDYIWKATLLIDYLGLYTTDAYQKRKEQIILRQQQEMLELSTPVVKLWHGVLALPIIGTLDSARTQIVMENLLQAIVDTDSEVAIIDITAVPTVDTLTSQHLLKTVAAARLMGAECIISGVRPQIAQTIVHLGVDLSTVTTKATLADAFALALQRSGRKVVRQSLEKDKALTVDVK